MPSYKVLSTKKISSSLIIKAKQNNIESIEQEFISIKPILTKEKYEQVMSIILNKGTSNIAFTSSNAVKTINNYLHQHDTYYAVSWKIFCLEGKTKETVMNSLLPKKNIIATAKNAKELAQKIIGHNTKKIIFFCGNKRRDELPCILKNAAIDIEEIVVYETVETPVIATENFDGILFFSPSAVKSFFAKNKLNTTTQIFAIGKTTADEVKIFSNNSIIISEIPVTENLIDKVIKYFSQIKTV